MCRRQGRGCLICLAHRTTPGWKRPVQPAQHAKVFCRHLVNAVRLGDDTCRTGASSTYSGFMMCPRHQVPLLGLQPKAIRTIPVRKRQMMLHGPPGQVQGKGPPGPLACFASFLATACGVPPRAWYQVSALAVPTASLCFLFLSSN
jgi:hypothetical protein